MKTVRAGFLAMVGVVALLPSAVSAQAFEGVIRQRVKTIMPRGVTTLLGGERTDPAQVLDAVTGALGKASPATISQQEVTFTVKGDRMRVDGSTGGTAAPGRGVYSIMDATSMTMYTVMPSRKQIVLATARDVSALQERMQKQFGLPAPSTAQPTQTALGTKRMAGVQAKGYRLVSADGAAVVWIDPALGAALAPFDGLQAQMALGASPLQNAVRALGVPLLAQIVTRAPTAAGSGWTFSESAVTSVKKKSVGDAVFALPADFKRTSLGR